MIYALKPFGALHDSLHQYVMCAHEKHDVQQCEWQLDSQHNLIGDFK